VKKILITGASGFIGGFLVEEALAQGYEVYAGVRMSSNLANIPLDKIKLLYLDYADKAGLEKILTKHGNSFDYIIHNAGITKARQPKDFLTVNYQYTKNFVEALQAVNRIPKKFVYISSLAAFGPGKKDRAIKHDDEPAPISGYGSSKLHSENFLRSLTGFPYVIIRPAAVYGPRDREFYVLYKVLNRGLEPYIATAKQKLSFIYVHDLVRAIFAAMQSQHSGRSYFIADGNEYTIAGFNETIKKHLQKKTVRIILPKEVAGPVAFSLEKIAALTGSIATFNRERLKEYEAPNWLCDTTPLREELNFVPAFNLDSGMQQTIAWYKQNKWLR
jgi:nucleoside-diphosphate-sugar epimerase